VREPAPRGCGAGQEGGFGQHLGAQGGGRQRGDLYDAGERGASGRGIEDMVRRRAARVEPAAPPDPARGHAAGAQRVLVQDGVVERALHPHDAVKRATQPQVAAAVDREALVPRQRPRGQVGEQALESAAVQPHAGRPGDDRGLGVGRDGQPAVVGVGPRGPSRRRVLEREPQRHRLADQVVHVADPLERAREREVNEPARPVRGSDARVHEGDHVRARAYGVAGIVVQRRELAGRVEPAEAVVEAVQQRARGRRRVAVTRHVDGTVGPEAAKRLDDMPARGGEAEGSGHGARLRDLPWSRLSAV
jgi:hypothetical protein